MINDYQNRTEHHQWKILLEYNQKKNYLIIKCWLGKIFFFVSVTAITSMFFSDLWKFLKLKLVLVWCLQFLNLINFKIYKMSNTYRILIIAVKVVLLSWPARMLSLGEGFDSRGILLSTLFCSIVIKSTRSNI